MYENSRHEYLSAMGIDSYMPRLILVNAAESIQCDWPELDAIEAAGEIAAPVDQGSSGDVELGLGPDSGSASGAG